MIILSIFPRQYAVCHENLIRINGDGGDFCSVMMVLFSEGTMGIGTLGTFQA